ncbi:MAG: sulfite exporter TauE/SafE family protein [Elusimicrobiota bacterium]|jgi:uncharacterized membrane protein YfcA|nr:sulfite exporter TauE/SafE family protein [Elusimicrobiota bacterium]
MELSAYSIILLAIAAFLTGVNKTGFPGLGIIVVIILPMIMPAKASTGYLLPLLIFGDIAAVCYWRNQALWKVIGRLMPWVVIGIIIGFFLMNMIPDESYSHIFGAIIVILFSLDMARRYFNIPIPMGKSGVTAFLGTLAGIMTMMINAAGPVMILYLLAMDISKEHFVATCAWTYFIFNLVKLPLSYSQGLITAESLMLNFKAAPFVLLGGIVGIIFMNKIPTKYFNTAIRVFTFLGAIKLFF